MAEGGRQAEGPPARSEGVTRAGVRGSRHDVIVAVAAPARGAIALLRLSGRGCADVCRAFLRSRKPLAARCAALRWLRDGDRPLDRALVTLFPAGSSYTGEETVEISTHGSPYVVERLLELAIEAGARPARPGEFTHRAFLNGRLDLSQAEAVCDLISARTRLAHRAAVSQLAGGLSRRVEKLRSGLLELSVLVEAGLDHPDEDLPLFSGGEAGGRLEAARAEVESLCRGFRQGRLSREGVRVAIVGRPNAGKSSLLNALMGEERAITAETPGTTRDTIEARADLDGLAAVLIDTAGFGVEARDAVEREGMARTRAALETADLAIFVMDRTVPAAEGKDLLDGIRSSDRPVIVALNKSDLGPARSGSDAFPGDVCVETSALTGAGMKALVGRIQRELGVGTAGDSRADEVRVTSARHAAALKETAAELKEAEALALACAPDGALAGDELVAAHLRGALTALGSIVGHTAPEDVLEGIFSRFCVGK